MVAGYPPHTPHGFFTQILHGKRFSRRDDAKILSIIGLEANYSIQ
jgi:hypothetical protein